MPDVLDFVPVGVGAVSVPVSGVGRWLLAVPPAQLLVADANPRDPSAAPENRPTIVRAFQSREPTYGLKLQGTSLRLRLAYPQDARDPGLVVVRVYGSEDYLFDADLNEVVNPGTFTPLRNLDNDVAAGFRFDPNEDAVSGTSVGGWPGKSLIVPPDNTAHTWDCDGCAAFRIIVERAFPYVTQTGFGGCLEAKIV